MRQRVDRVVLDRGDGALDVERGRGQQRLAQGTVTPGAIGVPGQARGLDQLANKAVAVGMHPVRGHAQQHVAFLDLIRQVGATFHRAHGKARQVKVALGVHAGHFRRLTADQRTARSHAALGDAFDDAGSMVDRQLAGGEVIQEEQRLCALADKVVDAHGHQVDAHAVHQAGVDGDAQLGADPVGGRDQDRILIARALQIEQRAESAQTGHRAGAVGALGSGFDPFDQVVACIDIHACIGIGDPVGFIAHPGSPAGLAPDRPNTAPLSTGAVAKGMKETT